MMGRLEDNLVWVERLLKLLRDTFDQADKRLRIVEERLRMPVEDDGCPGSILLRVTLDGAAVAGATVTVRTGDPDEGDVVFEGETDARGQVYLTVGEEETFYVHAEGPCGDGDTCEGSITLEAGPCGPNATVPLEPPTCTATFRATLNGQAVAGAVIEIYEGDSSGDIVGGGAADENGDLVVTLPGPGTYYLAASTSCASGTATVAVDCGDVVDVPMASTRTLGIVVNKCAGWTGANPTATVIGPDGYTWTGEATPGLRIEVPSAGTYTLIGELAHHATTSNSIAIAGCTDSPNPALRPTLSVTLPLTHVNVDVFASTTCGTVPGASVAAGGGAGVTDDEGTVLIPWVEIPEGDEFDWSISREGIVTKEGTWPVVRTGPCTITLSVSDLELEVDYRMATTGPPPNRIYPIEDSMTVTVLDAGEPDVVGLAFTCPRIANSPPDVTSFSYRGCVELGDGRVAYCAGNVGSTCVGDQSAQFSVSVHAPPFGPPLTCGGSLTGAITNWLNQADVLVSGTSHEPIACVLENSFGAGHPDYLLVAVAG